jgi:hypothetical protein
MKQKLAILFVFSISLLLILPIISLTNQVTLKPREIGNDLNDITLNTTMWKVNGTAVCTASKDQITVQVCIDGSGGAYLVWQDYRNNNWDIYAQRLNANGVPQWTANGVAVCTNAWDQYSPQITGDGTGGEVIVWRDLRNGGNPDIYAQRLNTAGVPQWTSNGIAVSNISNSKGDPVITAYLGYTFIAWSEYRVGGYSDIYAQCLNSAGVAQWTKNGTVICNATNSQLTPKICSDDNYGAFIAWVDFRNGISYDIYGQHIALNGTSLWKANGTAICTEPSTQDSLQITSGPPFAGGNDGVIATWRDARNGTGNRDIYAQWVNWAGTPQWIANGLPFCTANGDQQNPQICYSLSFPQSIIITWQDSRNNTVSGDDIYAQRYTFSGGFQWGSNGTALCTASYGQINPHLCSDANGGAIITWADCRRGTNYDIYVQDINATGAPQWDANGTAICLANVNPTSPQICPGSTGNSIIAWADNRNATDIDIYAKRMDSAPPMDFSILSMLTWYKWQTPSLICQFYEQASGGSGIDVSTVQFAYSTTGNPAPMNWAQVDAGVWTNPGCTNPASDGATGWLYAMVSVVPFNQDSGVNNTLRFRAYDMVNTSGTQGTAFVIKVDSMPPGSFQLVSPTTWIKNQTPTVICRFTENLSGIDVSTVQYAYSKTGDSAPTNWAPVNGVYTDAACTILATDSQTGWLYAKVSAAPFNQDSASLNTIRFQASDMAQIGGNLGTQATAFTVQIDSTIGAPIGLLASPSGSTTVNDFDLTWTNPSETSGIVSCYYKLDSPPVSNTDGIAVDWDDSISEISVSGNGAHPVYVWLVDLAGNVNYSKYSTTTLYLNTDTGGQIPLSFSAVLMGLGIIVAVFYLYHLKTLQSKKELYAKF